MQFLEEDDDPFMNNVPLRTSRGKAGGLNFAENYLSIYADKPENMYGDERDHFPCLYSICDARHQFQTDFFHSTIPYFFDDDMDLNPYVGFTQCPQFFHEMQDKLDYLDNNNAQFFRLNCMIRNCCFLARMKILVLICHKFQWNRNRSMSRARETENGHKLGSGGGVSSCGTNGTWLIRHVQACIQRKWKMCHVHSNVQLPAGHMPLSF